MAATVQALKGAPTASSPASQAAWPSAGVAYYTVIMMAVAVMFAEIDRTAMSLLVRPIKQVFHLNDSSMGFLMGPMFALFYALCGVPTSPFIDRFNRKNILAWALGLWSTASVFCGLAQNFAQLAVARLFLGAAESPNAPAIFSIIADTFPRSRITRGISLMQLGTTFGNGFSLFMTGVLIAVLMTLPDQHLGSLSIRWWQLVFIAIGIPGILAAVVLGLTVKEPARHVPAGQADRASMLQVLQYMRTHWKVYGAFLGSSAIGGLGFGVLSWTAEFYRRTYGWEPARIGMTLGVTSVVATLIGLFLGAWAYERLVDKGNRDAAMKVVVWGRLIGLPALLLLPLMPNGYAALAMSALAYIVLGATGASMNSILQIVTPNRMRAQATAIFFLFYNLIGQGLSPWLIGLFTDFVLKDESNLRYAILTANVLFQPAALFVLWLGMKPYRSEVEAIEAAEAAAA